MSTPTESLCAKQASNGARRAAGAASDIEHAPRATGANRCDEHVFEGLQYPIEQCLRFDPRAAGAPVPELRLLVFSLCSFHDRLLDLPSRLVFSVGRLHSATSSRLEVKR
jgi:hypothetical protein